MTGGTCQYLKINDSERSASQLTDIISKRVLFASGGDKGKQLVEAYENHKFETFYVSP